MSKEIFLMPRMLPWSALTVDTNSYIMTPDGLTERPPVVADGPGGCGFVIAFETREAVAYAKANGFGDVKPIEMWWG